VFHQGELRMLAGAVALFLAGLGWRAAHATEHLPPLVVHGQALEWSEPVAESAPSEPAHKVSSASSHRSDHQKPSLSGPINPNTATLIELESLPGVGPALAQRIVDARESSPLRSLTDLDRVKGIGPAKLEKLRSHLTF